VSDIAGNASSQVANYQFIWSAGTNGDDVYTISTTSDGTHVEVRKNNGVVPFSGTRSTLDAIGIGAGAGADHISIDMANASPIPPDGIDLDGGTDADQLTLLGTSGAESVALANQQHHHERRKDRARPALKPFNSTAKAGSTTCRSAGASGRLHGNAAPSVAVVDELRDGFAGRRRRIACL
jgi:hypothetical protein